MSDDAGWTKSTYSFSNGACLEWRTSSHCAGNGACVQVAPGVQVRDSKDPEGPVLTFDGSTWGRFTEQIRGT